MRQEVQKQIRNWAHNENKLQMSQTFNEHKILAACAKREDFFTCSSSLKQQQSLQHNETGYQGGKHVFALYNDKISHYKALIARKFLIQSTCKWQKTIIFIPFIFIFFSSLRTIRVLCLLLLLTATFPLLAQNIDKSTETVMLIYPK